MIRVALLAAVLTAACGAPADPPPAPFVTPRDRAALAARLPQRQDLVCFPCHSQLKFEKGAFPHKNAAHKNAGHCHLCHVGWHHDEERSIDRSACLTCHEEGSEELQILSRNDRTSN